jgi:arsenical resistance protein ArsH
MGLRTLPDPDFLPALDARYALKRPGSGLVAGPEHPPRILLLYGSLRERSYSRFVVEEAARLLRFFGAEPRIFDPSDLPLPAAALSKLPKKSVVLAGAEFGCFCT